MRTLSAKDPRAIALVEAIKQGDLAALRRLLHEDPELASATLVDTPSSVKGRSLLHVATDWPGHYPHCAETIRMLVDAGADVNARFTGAHTETPLHWAASSDDVEAIDALLDAGADIDAVGAVIAGGTPLSDAVAFAQWKAARRLFARGATVRFQEAAALGLLDRVEEHFSGSVPSQDEINQAFWYACHGGQHETAEFLLRRGANPNWLPTWEKRTALDGRERAATPRRRR